MCKIKKIAIIFVISAIFTILLVRIRKYINKGKENTYKIKAPVDVVPRRKMGFYEKYMKRGIDVICALLAIICFGWLYVIIAILVRLKLGSPVIFTQNRPGLIDSITGKETVFKIYKFRTMSDERDEKGNLLPDEVRLTKFGTWLRSTSLDESLEVFNILNGTMSVIGPRPQLIRDMVFMTPEQRMRHTAKPGLSGLAQIKGRNAITWEEKIGWDLKYIKHVSAFGDLKIIFQTVGKAFIKRQGITEGDMATAEDFGDYLLGSGKVTQEEYDKKQGIAKDILDRKETVGKKIDEMDDVRFSVSMCVYGGDNPEHLESSINSVVNQTVQPNEIVLTVDGPIPESTQSVIGKYIAILSESSINFRVVYLSENMGHGEARRICLNNCSYDLIALMDADDLSVPERFEKQLDFYKKNPEFSAVGGYIREFIGNPDNCVGKRIVPTDDVGVKEYMKKRCPMNQVTVMFKKKDVSAVGGYLHWYCEEDYYLWIRLALAGFKLGNIDENLVNVRIGDEMFSRRGGMRYFKSEAKLQKYMLDYCLITVSRYLINVSERFVLQVLMPKSLRGFIFQKLAREEDGRRLDMRKYKIGYTTGVYDMFHIGHLNIIQRAKSQCDYLIVGVTTDELCYKRKNRYPIIREADRMEIVRAIKYVDEVVPQETMDKIGLVKVYNADAVFVGSDWKGTDAWNKYEKEFAAVGCTVVYLDHTDGISSTILRDRLNNNEKPL